ncbi:hypothetical protein D3C87_1600240 [compost metagenome]
MNQIVIHVGTVITETQIFEFNFERADTHTTRKRRIDFKSFKSDALLFIKRHVVKRPHIMQTIGEFHQNHAHVFTHSHDHLANIFALFFVTVFKLHLTDFSHAIHKMRDHFTKLATNIFESRVRVFNSVMQKTCCNRV